MLCNPSTTTSDTAKSETRQGAGHERGYTGWPGHQRLAQHCTHVALAALRARRLGSQEGELTWQQSQRCSTCHPRPAGAPACSCAPETVQARQELGQIHTWLVSVDVVAASSMLEGISMQLVRAGRQARAGSSRRTRIIMTTCSATLTVLLPVFAVDTKSTVLLRSFGHDSGVHRDA